MKLYSLLSQLFYKKEDDKTSLYFLGIPLFSKQKKANKRIVNILGIKFAHKKASQPINGVPQLIDYLINSIILHDGLDEWQLNYLKHFFMSKKAKQQTKNPHAWLITIQALYLKGNKNYSKILLLEYLEKFGTTYLDRYGFVCELLRELNKNTAETDSLADFCQKISALRARQQFEKLVKKAKKIAIVGRSPILVGKSLGQEIDNHDLVIRFNNASTEAKYSKDYGSKTNVHVINCHLDNSHQDNVLCLYKDFHIYNMVSSVNDRLKKDILETDGKNVDVLDFDIKNKICQLSGLDDPTSGALIIMWIYLILGSLRNVDIYAFAFQDPASSLTHFDTDYSINTNFHNMTAEIFFLKQLIQENKPD